jgi:hypothetical protein
VKKLTEGKTKYDRSTGEAWLGKSLTCPECGGTFELERRDFEGEEVGANYDEPTWEVKLTERSPGGEQIIAGACGWCHKPISFTGHNDTGPIAWAGRSDGARE